MGQGLIKRSGDDRALADRIEPAATVVDGGVVGTGWPAETTGDLMPLLLLPHKRPQRCESARRKEAVWHLVSLLMP